jgi:Escherichia/Staphylococcus phage prohead protease
LKGGEEMRIEIRNDSVLLHGYVNAVGRESRELSSPQGKFKEVIQPKTFERALMKNSNVDLLFNHDKNKKLGSTKTGELELREDSIGLRATAKVSDPNVMADAKAGNLTGWSFGFSVNGDSWTSHEDGIQRRMVEDIDLYEVSILTNTPAYVGTLIESRGDNISAVIEQRIEDFQANIEDNSQKTTETKPIEERTSDFGLFELELDILKMKGSQNK